MLSCEQFIAGMDVIIPSAKFHNEGSTHVLQGKTGTFLLGSNAGDGGVTKLVPNIYYSRNLSDRIAFGIGIHSSFGFSSKKQGHPLKGPLSRDKRSVTENLIKYFPFIFLMEPHGTFFAPDISSIAGCG